MHSRFGRTLVVSLMALSPAAVQAGSPLTCFPMPIGDARSLAWGSGAAGTRRAPTTIAPGSPWTPWPSSGPGFPSSSAWRRCGAR